MLKNILVALLVLAALAAATEISFTADPLEIDRDEDNQYYWGVYLPNTGCRAMAEFQSGERQGDVMVIDFCRFKRNPESWGDKDRVCGIWYNIWSPPPGDEWEDEFQRASQSVCLIDDNRYKPGEDYSQLLNASIFSSYDGVIHMGGWFGYAQMAHAYSRYLYGGGEYSWNGYPDDDSYESAMYFYDEAQRRFGQVLQPAFYVNEYKPTPMSPPTVEPTFVVNGHDWEDSEFIVKAGFYFQTLTETSVTYDGIWNDPVVLSPQTFGNMGFASVTGDQSGKLHLFWESSINTGYANSRWHSTIYNVRQNELYYTNVTNGQVGQIAQLTDNYATSGENEFIGINLISSDVDPNGNVWAIYDLYSKVGGDVDKSIGIVKLSSSGILLYGPTLLESYNDLCYSPQIQIDDEGIAHCVFIKEGSLKELYYGNFDTQNPVTPIALGDLTVVSRDETEDYPPGVGHIFVDSARRIHFVWNSIPDGYANPRLYYRRSENLFTARSGNERRSTSAVSAALQPDPIEFRVEDAFPNPASEMITFSYSLPKAERVTIKVYDLAGRLVAVPVDEVQSVGHHTLEWNLEEQTGLANGLYLYTLQAGENVQTKRLVIGR